MLEISHTKEFVMSNMIPITDLDILKRAAENGDIDLLYTVLKTKPSILEGIDSIQFFETPLHIAASKERLHFAIEVMNLKPSFALKLNPEGLSPVHIAIQKKNMRMVLRFVDMNNELVRVKGKGGLTPLHLASQIGDLDILAVFLRVCPNSIEDVTVWGETALHIAAKKNKHDALYRLVYFLRSNKERGARMLEYAILNQKDELDNDNTILHISAEKEHPKEIIQLLLKTNIKLNAKNSENKTALDMATGEEIKKLLSSAGAKSSSKLSDSQTLGSEHKPIITMWDKVEIHISRIKSISEEQRNTLLIIVTLIVTATYQSVLSPPGGFYQANATDNNLNITASSNSTISSLGSVGKSVLSKKDFFLFSYLSMLSFFTSILTILALTPRGRIAFGTLIPMMVFTISYLYSMWKISPTSYNYIIVGFFFIIIVVVLFIFYTIFVYSIVQRRLNARKLNRLALLKGNTGIGTNTLTV